MRICFLMLSHWSGNLGGAEIQVRYLMDYLRTNTDHEVSFVCRHATVTHDEDVAIHRTWPVPPFGRWFKSADAVSIWRWLTRLRPDVIYTRVSSPYVGVAAAYCRRHGSRLVHHVARIEDVTPSQEIRLRHWARRLERPLYEYGLRRAHAIIAQAEYQRRLLREHYGLDVAGVIPNFHPSPGETPTDVGRRTIVWVANLKRDKRPELFVDLARRCLDLEDVEFLMIGAVQDPSYARLTTDLAQVPNLRFLGPRTLEDVNRILGQARLFVNTSRPSGEGFPNTFIQAWLRGTPTASLEVDPDGLIARHRTGVAVGGDMARLTDEVRELVRQPGKARELGQNAAAFARLTYGLDNCRRIVEILEGRTQAQGRAVA
jgi:glycosyltransferase involved in cell wall biosynthesis